MFDTTRTFIIAEAGVNHNGDMALARELIDIAVTAKADAVKFQTFITKNVISRYAEQAAYQIENTGKVESQLDMVKRLELTHEEFHELYLYCREKGIAFMSTAFDRPSLEFLMTRCEMPVVKIPSGEVTNALYLYETARYRRPMVLSTGMASLNEIGTALAVLSYGWTHDTPPNSLQQCLDYFATTEGRSALKGQISILQCVTEYPAPAADTNLRAMETIRATYDVPVGLSDHSLGIHIPVAAVALGATVIEKHYTIDKNMPGPDHKASLSPQELTDMVHQIREVEQALGNGIKTPQASEVKNIAIARRSLIAGKDIAAGETLTPDNLVCKRPGGGISAIYYFDYLNKNAASNVDEDRYVAVISE